MEVEEKYVFHSENLTSPTNFMFYKHGPITKLHQHPEENKIWKPKNPKSHEHYTFSGETASKR